MFRNICCALVAARYLSAVACAAPIVTAGDHDLLPNTPGQVIPILVSGVAGATVNDGVTGPTIGSGTVSREWRRCLARSFMATWKHHNRDPE